MKLLEWKYIKELIDIDCFQAIKEKYNVDASNELKECIVNFNGARPTKDAFDTESVKEREIKRLLSFNKSDTENVYDVFNVFKEENISLYPFAMDPAGNYICEDINSRNIIFYNHENQKREYINKDFKHFLNSLYE